MSSNLEFHINDIKTGGKSFDNHYRQPAKSDLEALFKLGILGSPECDEDMSKIFLMEQYFNVVKYGKVVRKTVCDKYNLNLDSIKFKNGSNGSMNLHTKEIIIPTGGSRSEIPYRYFNLFKQTDEDLLIYPLTHEIAHIIFADRYNNDKTFVKSFTAFVNRQKKAGCYLTTLGAENYKHKKHIDRVHEDIIELMTLYMYNPELLKKYLQFLSSNIQKDKREKGQRKVIQLSEEEANLIFGFIDENIKSFLSS